MEGEEYVARDNLVNLSQNTNYLSDWTQKAHKKKKKVKSINQDNEHQHQSRLKRQNSDKYNLKRWQIRMQSLKKIQYPIINDVQNFEDSMILPKCKVTPKSQSQKLQSKRKEDFDRSIYRIIQEGLMKKKLQVFRNKIQLLQKNITQRQQKYKPIQLPKTFMTKRHSKPNIFDPKSKNSQQRGVPQLKSQLQRQKRKYSMPNLVKIHQSKYMQYFNH